MTNRDNPFGFARIRTSIEIDRDESGLAGAPHIILQAVADMDRFAGQEAMVPERLPKDQRIGLCRAFPAGDLDGIKIFKNLKIRADRQDSRIEI